MQPSVMPIQKEMPRDRTGKNPPRYEAREDADDEKRAANGRDPFRQAFKFHHHNVSRFVHSDSPRNFSRSASGTSLIDAFRLSCSARI